MRGRKNFDAVELTKERKADAVKLIKDYIEDNFECEAGNVKAASLVNFISENLGRYYYNKGIEDAYGFMEERLESMFELMKREDAR